MFHVKIFHKDGRLLLQTWNKGENSRDTEIQAALSRKEVGKVVWWGDGRDPHPMTTVYNEK